MNLTDQTKRGETPEPCPRVGEAILGRAQQELGSVGSGCRWFREEGRGGKLIGSKVDKGCRKGADR